MASIVTLEELGGWPFVLRRLTGGEDLTSTQATAALADVLEGNATPAQIAAFAVALRLKGVTTEEIVGLTRAMLDAAEPVTLSVQDVLDTCGSGGSPQRKEATFNVSTIAAFVVAGGGVAVCKHGGRAATATSSSFDLLEALGVAIDLGPAGVARCVEEVGIGFCFAPRFHPAMRHAAPVRRELGIPTIFNFLGPLTNPARPRRQVLGVGDPSMAEKMLDVLEANGATHAMVVYGHDGLDELTTTTTSTVLHLADGERRTFVVDPATVGIAPATGENLRGGDAARNSELAAEVLAGEQGPHRDVVVLNAAAGLVVGGRAKDIAEGVVLAAEAIDSGRALEVKDRLVQVSQAAAAG